MDEQARMIRNSIANHEAVTEYIKLEIDEELRNLPDAEDSSFLLSDAESNDALVKMEENDEDDCDRESSEHSDSFERLNLESEEQAPQKRRLRKGHRDKKSVGTKKQHQNLQQYSCDHCEQSFSKENLLLSHLISSHEKISSSGSSTPCCFCYASFHLKQSNQLHLQLKHNWVTTTSHPFKCVEKDCETLFETHHKLNEHLSTHSKPIHHCSICQWGFLLPDLVKLHELTHTKPINGRYPCPAETCKCTPPTIKELQSHFNTRHGSNLGSFPCIQCGLILSKEISLKKHLKKHENNEHEITELQQNLAPPPCSVCGLQFLNFNGLDDHRRSVHNLGVECPFCNKLFSCRDSWLRHNRNVHKAPTKDSSHQCPHCEKVYKIRSYLLEHIALKHANLRGAEGKHECPHCHARFLRNLGLWKHLSKCDKNPEKGKRKVYPTRGHGTPSPCLVCGKPVFKHEVEYHLSTHLGPEESLNYPCNRCSKVFTLNEALRKHLMKIHGTVANEEEEECHVCHLCGKVLLNKNNLKIHIETHSGEKKFVCHLCSVKFTAKTTLKRHLNIKHGKEKGHEFTPGGVTIVKSHSCMHPSCANLKFDTEVELRLHVEQFHVNQRQEESQFMCNLCGKVFANQARLTRHDLIHTKEKKHKCQVCSTAFAHKSSLREHLEAMHGVGKEKQYFECEQPNCGAAYKCRQYLYKHLRRVHGVYTAKPKKKNGESTS
ncbi:unnamed protein product [Orchesella dallaii]|uniref:C2H2-type domain-containing protein n=1 Tax=Orchesella dallaii TaxID=48710 RepID=A0ABP1RHI7_9HEXA